jgi:hypothetical protein
LGIDKIIAMADMNIIAPYLNGRDPNIDPDMDKDTDKSKDTDKDMDMDMDMELGNFC